MKKLLLLGILSATGIETLDAAEKRNQKYFESKLPSNQNHKIGVLSSSAPSTFGFNPSAPAFTATTPPPPPNSPDSEDELFLSSPEEIDAFKLWKQQQRQGDMHYRSAGSLNITGQIKTHRRQRSSSNPEDLVAATQQLSIQNSDLPGYQLLNIQSTDCLLEYCNKTLKNAREEFEKITKQMENDIKDAAEKYQELSTTSISTRSRKKSFLEKVKLQSKEAARTQELEKQMKENTKQELAAKKTLAPIVVGVALVAERINKMQKNLHEAKIEVDKRQQKLESTILHSPAASRRSDSGYGSNNNSNA